MVLCIFVLWLTCKSYGTEKNGAGINGPGVEVDNSKYEDNPEDPLDTL